MRKKEIERLRMPKEEKPVKRLRMPEKKPHTGGLTRKFPDAWGPDNLTLMQRLFVAAYVGPAGGSITAAYKMAGYKALKGYAGGSGGYLLAKPNVQKAIANLLARKMMSPEWAKDMLAATANSSMTNFLRWDKKTQEWVTDLKKGQRYGALDQIKRLWYDSQNRPCIELHDKNKAHEILLKFYKLIDGNDGNGSDPAKQIPVEIHPTDGTVEAPQGTVPADE